MSFFAKAFLFHSINLFSLEFSTLLIPCLLRYSFLHFFFFFSLFRHDDNFPFLLQFLMRWGLNQLLFLSMRSRALFKMGCSFVWCIRGEERALPLRWALWTVMDGHVDDDGGWGWRSGEDRGTCK